MKLYGAYVCFLVLSLCAATSLNGAQKEGLTILQHSKFESGPACLADSILYVSKASSVEGCGGTNLYRVDVTDGRVIKIGDFACVVSLTCREKEVIVEQSSAGRATWDVVQGQSKRSLLEAYSDHFRGFAKLRMSLFKAGRAADGKKGHLARGGEVALMRWSVSQSDRWVALIKLEKRDDWELPRFALASSQLGANELPQIYFPDLKDAEVLDVSVLNEKAVFILFREPRGVRVGKYNLTTDTFDAKSAILSEIGKEGLSRVTASGESGVSVVLDGQQLFILDNALSGIELVRTGKINAISTSMGGRLISEPTGVFWKGNAAQFPSSENWLKVSDTRKEKWEQANQERETLLRAFSENHASTVTLAQPSVPFRLSLGTTTGDKTYFSEHFEGEGCLGKNVYQSDDPDTPILALDCILGMWVESGVLYVAYRENGKSKVLTYNGEETVRDLEGPSETLASLPILDEVRQQLREAVRTDYRQSRSFLYGVLKTSSRGMSHLAFWETGKSYSDVLEQGHLLGGNQAYRSRKPWQNSSAEDWAARDIKYWAVTPYGVVLTDSTSRINEWAMVSYFTPYLWATENAFTRLPTLDGTEISGIQYFEGGLVLTYPDRDEIRWVGIGPNPFPDKTAGVESVHEMSREEFQKIKGE